MSSQGIDNLRECHVPNFVQVCSVDQAVTRVEHMVLHHKEANNAVDIGSFGVCREYRQTEGEVLNGRCYVALHSAGLYQFLSLHDDTGSRRLQFFIQLNNLALHTKQIAVKSGQPTHIQTLGLGSDLQQFPDGVDEALVVVVAHPLDVLVMTLDARVQALHELLMFVPIVDGSTTTCSLLVITRGMVFLISRIFEWFPWYQNSVSSIETVDPFILSVRQLKLLLETRGVSYTGYIEKKELVQLVEDSASVVQGEVESLIQSHGGDVSNRARIANAPSSSQFTGGPHFYEEVEDTKDSVWLVQVVPAGALSEPLLDDYSWRIVCNQVAPFAIRTGIFDCRLDRRLCMSKGWHEPQLLLALPKGTRAKDRVVMKTFSSTRPQSVIEWVRDQLSIRVKSIQNLEEVKCDWLGQCDGQENSTKSTVSSSKDIKVLLLTHLLHPPLFLAALSIKFTGRIKFGMLSVKRDESEMVRKKLKLSDHRVPSYMIITPEKKVVYGRRRFEHFNFDSMNLFLKAVQPEMNDVFLCSLVLVNMLVGIILGLDCVPFTNIIIRIAPSNIRTHKSLIVTLCLWWKRLARCVWNIFIYNFCFLITWMVILAMSRFTFVGYFAEKILTLLRYVSLNDIGSMIRMDCQLLIIHPYFFLSSFIVFGLASAWILRRKYPIEMEQESSLSGPWWEVLPVDSHWINCFFRPMSTLSRPLPSNNLELEEGIEMLIERLAVPNLWLQPVIHNEYIKDLPVWKFKSLDRKEPNLNSEPSRVLDDSPEMIQWMMDGDDPRKALYHNTAMHCCNCNLERIKYRNVQSSPPNAKRKVNKTHDCGTSEDCSECVAATVDTGDVNTMLCSMCKRNNVDNSSQSASTPCPCPTKRTGIDRLLPAMMPTPESLAWDTDSGREGSEDSSDEGSITPVGMLPVSECAVCLESYVRGATLCGLPCGHNYHQNCIMMWLSRDNHHCPVCRWPAYKTKPVLTHLHKE
uniref:RING-type domain-containing protein n=1 Tax=Timema cristinae TaxID=61476 RepID=A0A7R9CCD4_TIMCR|nr:unnamed protein product [Timema cristinae]